MSFFDKQNQWLLCNQDEVIWIVGERVDRRYFKSKKAANSAAKIFKSKYKNYW